MSDFPSNISPPPPDELLEMQPAFRRLDDSKGVAITNRTTLDRHIKITGYNVLPDSGVIIMNLNDELGRATSDPSGEFETALLPLSKYDCHEVRIVGDYDVGPSSLPRKFTAAREKPAITQLSSNGVPVSPGDTIPGPDVTVACDSLPNVDSRLFNDATLLKTESVNACGKVTFELTALVPGEYSITVKDPSDNESEAFKFILGEDVITPVTLDKVTTAAGIEVPDNSETPETSLFVEGEGEKGAKAEVFKDGASLGEAIVDATTGRYKHPTGLLSNGPHVFTVTAKYPNGGSAGPYTVKVKAPSTAPRDVKIHDKDGNEIPDKGETFQSYMIVRGNHEPDSKVIVKITDFPPLTEETHCQGRFLAFQNGLVVGKTYEYFAVREDDENVESDKRTVTARAPARGPSED